MVFKPDFSFNPRPVTPNGASSRSCSPEVSPGRKPQMVEDGEVSPSSKVISIISSPWSSNRSSMTSITSLRKQNCQFSPSVFTGLVIDGELIVLPAVTLTSDYECAEEGDEYNGEAEIAEKIEKMRIKEHGTLSINTKTSIFKGFHAFPFHSKKKDDAPSSPVIPIARTPISPVPITPNARATAHSRFRLFKSTPKRTKNSHRPPPLDLQAPREVSPPFTIRRVNVHVSALEPSIILDTSMLAPEQYDFTESPEAGVQLLSQTLEEECDDGEGQEVEHTKAKEEIFRSYSYLEETTHREEVTPIYLTSPWFDASRGVSPMSKTTETEATAIKHPQTYLQIPSNIFESIPTSPIFSPLTPKENITVLVPEYGKLPNPSSLEVQPPTPRSAASSSLFDDGDGTDIEDSPALVYTKIPSIPNSRKSSIATFFCRGQNNSHIRNDSIDLGGLNDDEIEINDAELIYYPGINTFKTKTSWLYNSPPDNSSSDDEDDEDSEIEEAYQKHLPMVSKVRRKSTTSLTGSITSTPELMLSSVSSASSYGQMLSTPPRRRDRRRTASSDCIVLEALEEMQAAGLKDLDDLEKSKGLGFFRSTGVSSEWADGLWEMDTDGQATGWGWEAQQVPLIGL